MRMLNELIVRGEPSRIAKLVERLRDVDQEGWKREPEFEDRLQSMGGAPGGAICFAWQGSFGCQSATVFLHKRGSNELSVANIFPKERTPLSDDEHNEILARFEREILRPLSMELGVEITLIRPVARLESSLSPEALRRLKAFSSSANRVDPHPSDWRRWDQFLVQIHQDESLVDDVELALWLVGQGWTDSQFAPFLDRFRTGQSLLTAYDAERAAR